MMRIKHHLIIAWASLRVTYLNNLKSYEDSYALSQEFREWTTSSSDYPSVLEATTLIIPDFNKENRTN